MFTGIYLNNYLAKLIVISQIQIKLIKFKLNLNYRRTNPGYYSLNFGYNDRLSPNSWSASRSVNKIIPHENFNRQTFFNDIALMKLNVKI